MENPLSYPCPRCGIGVCHHSLQTFVTTFADTLFSVPDVPAYLCDVCNYREFDGQALDEIEMLLEEQHANLKNPPANVGEHNSRRA